jgi:hypothetical protein
MEHTQPTAGLFDPGHLRLVSEVQIRNKVLDEMNDKYLTDLDRWRGMARHKLYSNAYYKKYGIPWAITIADIREIFKDELAPDPDSHANKKLGSFFRDPAFQWTGQWYQTTTPGCHARPIKIWTLSDQRFIDKWGRIPGGAIRKGAA